jgi:hypothetical protein
MMKATQQANQAARMKSMGSSRATRLTAAPAFNTVVDFGRQQAVVATESACAIFRGFEAMRKIQEEAAHQAAQRHAEAAQKLRGNCQPADLMAVQSELLRFDFDAAGRYWQQLAAAALEMQTEIMGCGARMIDSEAVLAGSSALDAMQFKIPRLDAFLAAGEAMTTVRGNPYQPRAEAS